MGLANLFRPKHKHSNAAVRAEAVRELGADDADLLASVARGDRDPDVRRIAVEKIEDPGVLSELASADPDASVQGIARARAVAMWTSIAAREDGDRHIEALDRLVDLGQQRALTDLACRAARAPIREAALDRLDDARAFADVVRGAADPAQRAAALERLEDVDLLRGIATDEPRKDVGCAAVDRIEAREALEMIAARAKNRAVRSRAKRKLDSVKVEREPEQISEDKKRHAEQVQLCRTVEALARANKVLESEPEMARARAQWEQLGSPGGRVEARFQRAVRRYEERRGQARRAAAGRAAAGAGGAAASGAAAAEAEPAAAAEPGAPPRAGDEPADRDDRADGADRDDEAARDGGADRDDEAARAAAASAKQQQASRREQARQNLEALAALVEELEARVSTDSIKSGERALKRAQSGYAKLEPLPAGGERDQLALRYETARQKLVIRVRELREAEDWKRWANVPKQEQLIERVRALLTDEDEANLLPKLKEAQADWKKLGPGPRDRSQTLWNEFKQVGDQVYERVVAYRARRAEAQGENLARKIALCERAEELAESTDWEATAAEIKRLQAEWKQAGPVPRKQADAIWKRFRGACDRFFDRRKPHLDKQLGEQAENLSKKEAVCEAIEKLAESAEDWEQAVAELKRLRREWREVGRVPRRGYAALGERFRAACDRFDARRAEAEEAVRTAARAAVDEAMAAVEARLGRPSAADIDAQWTVEPAPESREPAGEEGGSGPLAAAVFALRAALKEAGRVAGADDAALHEKVAALVGRAVAADPDGFRGSELDPETSRARGEKLCERAERLIPEAPAGPAADATPEEIADKLRAALAKNALGGAARAEERSIPDLVAELREAWERLGPMPGAAGEALAQRFRNACERALAGVSEAAPPARTPAPKGGAAES